MAGNRRALVLSGKCSATAPPARAPTSNWPSAPIFQTFARNPTDKPTAHSIKGVAFRNSSATPYRSLSGFRKNTLKPSTGSLPSRWNSSMPLATIRPTASNGER